MKIAARAIAAACLMTAALASNALASPDGSFLKYGAPVLSSHMGISLSQAERDIEVQQSAGNIVPKLKEKLGANYAGAWFDLQTGQFHVDIASPADRGAAETVMNDAGVLGAASIEEVQNSWGTVEETAKAMNAKMSALTSKQQAMIIPNPRTNGVTVELASNLSPALISQAEATTTSTSVPTQIAPLAPSSLEAKPAACSFPYCERPVRGGVGIISSPENGILTLCTAGFFSKRP